MAAATEQTSNAASAQLSTLSHGLSSLKVSNTALTHASSINSPDRSSDDE